MCRKVRNAHLLEEYLISVFRQRVPFYSRAALFSCIFFKVAFLSFLFLFLPSLPIMLSFSFHVYVYIRIYMDMYGLGEASSSGQKNKEGIYTSIK
jgi:hypothetical protein